MLLFANVLELKSLCGPEDSLIKKYAKNDPRNPDCPCHKYQRKAEKEFEKHEKEMIKLKAVNTKNAPCKNKRKILIGKQPRKHKLSLNIRNRRFLLIKKKSVDSCVTW